jgi:hypothetical protein
MPWDKMSILIFCFRHVSSPFSLAGNIHLMVNCQKYPTIQKKRVKKMNNSTDCEISLEILAPRSRATAVVVQTVQPEQTHEFLEWQRGITGDASLHKEQDHDP